MEANNNIIYFKFKFRHLTRKRNPFFLLISLPIISFFILFFQSDFEIRSIFSNRTLVYINLAILLFYYFRTFIPITKEILIDNNSISFKRIYNIRWDRVEYKYISHFCYYDKIVSDYDFDRKLLIYFKKGENNDEEVKHLQLSFAENDIYTILSHLYRAGFKVLLFEEYLNIEESDKYIP